MLQQDDFNRLLQLLESVMAESNEGVATHPENLLSTHSNGLYRVELRRLYRSVQIAVVLGDAPPIAASIIDLIYEAIQPEQKFAPLTEDAIWKEALRWALQQLQKCIVKIDDVKILDRQWEVGRACKQLREDGYEVHVNAFGPSLSLRSHQEIVSKINAAVRIVGGINAADQVCRYMRELNRIHDQMWLYGENNLGIYSNKQPSLPVGWLFSLAIRNFSTKARLRKPEIAWNTATRLASNFAACHDCERYSQFEQINIHPAEFSRTLADSLHWREFFTLPQVPPPTLRHLRHAFKRMTFPCSAAGLAQEIDVLFREAEDLLHRSVPDNLTIHNAQGIERQYPRLWRHARAHQGKVNEHFLDPADPDKRTHDQYVLFQVSRDKVITLPSSMLTSAVCEVIFRHVWKSLPGPIASKIVGSVMESAIENACHKKATTVLAGEHYTADGKNLEIDVATRTDQDIVLFELKAKSLTSSARSGDMIAFVDDFNKSCLYMLRQLVRHDGFLRQGQTPLTKDGECPDNLRPLKVAVSPLSYGPISDKVLTTTLLRSIAYAKLRPVVETSSTTKSLNDFNKTVSTILEHVTEIAPKRDGAIDLLGYFLDVFWLDLGQVIYVIERGKSVWDGLSAMHRLTFNSRDFWTEVAMIDRQKLSRKKWRMAGQASV